MLFRTFYVSIFHYKIDSPEEYSLATGKAMSFTYFKPQYITQENLVFNFLYCQEPVKSSITKSRKNLVKQDKIDLEKQILSSGLQNR